jgi:hypothetical protein
MIFEVLKIETQERLKMNKFFLIIGSIIAMALSYVAISSNKVEGKSIMSLQKSANEIQELEGMNCGGF